MVLSVLIARVNDGLPLAASTEQDQGEVDLAAFKTQAKHLFKRLSDASPTRCTLETQGGLVFHYAIEDGVCYLAICRNNYSKKLAFAFLEDIQREFHKLYASEFSTVARPYAFITFDNYIQKARRQYVDSRGAAKNLEKVNAELMDVQRIMVRNIDEVLLRGEKVKDLDDQAARLKMNSKDYLKDAKMLAWQAFYQKYGPVAAVLSMVLFFLYWRFMW